MSDPWDEGEEREDGEERKEGDERDEWEDHVHQTPPDIHQTPPNMLQTPPDMLQTPPDTTRYHQTCIIYIINTGINAQNLYILA